MSWGWVACPLGSPLESAPCGSQVWGYLQMAFVLVGELRVLDTENALWCSANMFLLMFAV